MFALILFLLFNIFECKLEAIVLQSQSLIPKKKEHYFTLNFALNMEWSAIALSKSWTLLLQVCMNIISNIFGTRIYKVKKIEVKNHPIYIGEIFSLHQMNFDQKQRQWLLVRCFWMKARTIQHCWKSSLFMKYGVWVTHLSESWILANRLCAQ